jgi:hypothetical protein
MLFHYAIFIEYTYNSLTSTEQRIDDFVMN